MEEYAHYEVKMLDLPDEPNTIRNARQHMLLFLWSCDSEERFTAPDGTRKRRLTFRRSMKIPHHEKLTALENKLRQCDPQNEALQNMYMDSLHRLHVYMLLAIYDPDSLPYNAFND